MTVALLLALALAVTTLVPGTALADDSSASGQGRLDERQHTSDNGVNEYLVYVPSRYLEDPEWIDEPRPLVVVIHGCLTDAREQLAANAHQPVAERHGFVVLFPQVNDNNPLNCWRAIHGDPRSTRRDSGDAAVVAGITREAIRDYTIDPERVYVVGHSSGAFQTGVLAVAYPDLYAAVGIHSGGGYLATWGCGATSRAEATSIAAAQAGALEMGRRARVVPMWVLSGDRDSLLFDVCTWQALDQNLRMNNLVLSGSQAGPLSHTPAHTRSDAVPGGREFTVDTFLDAAGCVIGERWVVHGMGHRWSGGSGDPAHSGSSDPTGPNAAEASWRFFDRFRLSDTGGRCATSGQ